MPSSHPPPPEQYLFSPTPHVPNSPLPVLLYRSVLKPTGTEDLTAASVRDQIEPNGWIQGGVFKTFRAHHFHSVTHECYAVFRGSSRLLLGRGPLDDSEESDGDRHDRVEVVVSKGDAIVLPAGVAHCSVSSEGDYEYVGLYPEGSPHYDNNFCKANSAETESKAQTCRQVPIPESDPLYGVEGALPVIWRDALASI